MEIISNKLDSTIYIPKEIEYKLANKKICFFDIETTGFSRYKDKVVLIGVLYPSYDGKGIEVIQFFANTLEDEKELLVKFIGFITKFDSLISFNGDTFDIPFLNSRFKSNNIDYKIDKQVNLDLLKVVRQHQNILELDNCRLKTVEKSLGIQRKDTISGKDSVDLYKEYLKSKDINYKNMILQHNYEDILYLPQILNIYDVIRDMSIVTSMIRKQEYNLYFELDMRDIEFKGDRLEIKGKSKPISSNKQIYYKENYSFEWIPTKGIFSLSLLIRTGKLSTGKSCAYIDQSVYQFSTYLDDHSDYSLPKNIILLLDNKTLIHKNIAPILKSLINQILNDLYI